MTKTPEIPVFKVNTGGPIDFGEAHLPAAVRFTTYAAYLQTLRCIAADLVHGYMAEHKDLFLEATVRYIAALGCPDTPEARREYGAACVDVWATQQIDATAVALRRSGIKGP